MIRRFMDEVGVFVIELLSTLFAGVGVVAPKMLGLQVVTNLQNLTILRKTMPPSKKIQKYKICDTDH